MRHYKQRQNNILVVRRSCLTGKVVWIYWGPSYGAANVAYCRACKQELQRVRRHEETSAQRKQRILDFLNDCLNEIPITESLSPRQVEASRKLKALGKEDIATYKEFYQHIIEERRCRKDGKKMPRRRHK